MRTSYGLGPTARYRHRIPVRDFPLILGMLALIDGGVHLFRSLFAFHIEPGFFPVLMVIIGTIMAVHAVDRLREFDGADQGYLAIEKPKRGTYESSSPAEEETDFGLDPSPG